jgi:hypothetical protein
MAGLTFLASQIISFVAGLIVGFIISIIFQIIWCLIFSCSTPHYNCELDTPWYNDEYTGIREKVVRLGDTLHYVYYGVRYCYDPNYRDYYHPDQLRFFVDLYYQNSNFGPDIFGNGTIFDLHTSYCTTLDGRCFDCSVNVTKPGPEIPEGNEDFPGSFNATATWNDMEQLSHPRYPSYPFENPIPILVCPEDKRPDESEFNCVDCNPDHTELGFCTGTNTASCNHNTEVECLADSCCNYDYVYNKCYPKEWCVILNKNVCDQCSGCHMQSSGGTCEEGCGASPECDERNPGEVWCDENMKKSCNSTCQVSEEICRTDAEDTDSGKNYYTKGICTDYQGCSNGVCASAQPQSDACVCIPKCYGTSGCNDVAVIRECAKRTNLGKSYCEANSNCSWGLMEFYPSSDTCEWEFINCINLGSKYYCSDGYCSSPICKTDGSGNATDGLCHVECNASVNCAGVKPGLANTCCFGCYYADITGGPNGTSDGKVDMKDVRFVAGYFGKSVPPAPENADINKDGSVDMKDTRAVAKKFGVTCMIPTFKTTMRTGLALTYTNIVVVIVAIILVVIVFGIFKFFVKKK